MKLSLFCIILCWLSIYCNNDKSSEKFQKDIPEAKTLLDRFKYHFKILDSVVQQKPLDTLYHCCILSIDFMEQETEMEPSSPDNFLGRLYFSKKDWEKWHSWYRNKYGGTK